MRRHDEARSWRNRQLKFFGFIVKSMDARGDEELSAISRRSNKNAISVALVKNFLRNYCSFGYDLWNAITPSTNFSSFMFRGGKT